MSTKSAFVWRILITTIIVFVLWTLIARQYAAVIDSAVRAMIWNVGFYVERTSGAETSLLSPLIPFMILMISTWGKEFVIINKRLNYKLWIWFMVISVMLLGFTILGQYLAIFMIVSNTGSQTMWNVTSFFIATAPLLIPIVAWFALSKNKLMQIMETEKKK